ELIANFAYVGETVANVAGTGLACYLRLDFASAHSRGQQLCDGGNRAVLAAANVIDISRSCGVVERQQESAYNVADMHEIAALLAILENHRPLAVEQARGENGEHACVGIGKRLP